MLYSQALKLIAAIPRDVLSILIIHIRAWDNVTSFNGEGDLFLIKLWKQGKKGRVYNMNKTRWQHTKGQYVTTNAAQGIKTITHNQ